LIYKAIWDLYIPHIY